MSYTPTGTFTFQFNPFRRHTDQEVTEAIRYALGMDRGVWENIAKFTASLLVARGFSDNDHYFAVFSKVSEVNNGSLTVDQFASWLDHMFPGGGVWREEEAALEEQANRQYFGTQVMGRRKEKGLTRTALACMVGVSPSNVQRWEDGITIPRDHIMVRLGNALGVNPARLWADANGVEF
jgi:DNA-binding transcriptional regulator YiaG